MSPKYKGIGAFLKLTHYKLRETMTYIWQSLYVFEQISNQLELITSNEI